jgi:Uncharacterized conserved protein
MSDSAEQYVIHRSASGETQGLATEVEVADHWLRQGIGLMFRRRIGGDQAMVFDFDGVSSGTWGCCSCRSIWTASGWSTARSSHTERLEAWTGRAGARADRVIEVAPGVAETVHEGSEIEVIEE